MAELNPVGFQFAIPYRFKMIIPSSINQSVRYIAPAVFTAQPEDARNIVVCVHQTFIFYYFASIVLHLCS